MKKGEYREQDERIFLEEIVLWNKNCFLSNFSESLGEKIDVILLLINFVYFVQQFGLEKCGKMIWKFF